MTLLARFRMAAFAAIAVLVAGCSASSAATDEQENATLRLHLYAADLVIMGGYALDGDQDVEADMQSSLDGMTQLVADMRARDNARTQRIAPLLARAGADVGTLSGTALARREAHAAAERALLTTPQVSARLDELVRALSLAGAKPAQTGIANREIVLADRMGRRITEIVQGRAAATASAEALARDVAVFSQVLDAMRDGRDDLGIARLDSPQERAALDGLDKLRAPYAQDVQTVLAAQPVFESAYAAADDLRKVRNELYAAAPPRR